MSKLTLSVDGEVISRAKQYAKQRGQSLSEMVEVYLAAVSGPGSRASHPPVLRALRGALKNVSLEDYRKHLADKYR